MGRARERGWWEQRAQLTTPARAVRFVEDVGFALLFQHRDLPFPVFWEVARDDPPVTMEDWGPDIRRVWAWKDTLPLTGKVWSGQFVASQRSLLSADLLADLYPGRGDEDDFTRVEGLPPLARRLAELLHDNGPMSTAELRLVLNLGGKQSSKLTQAVVQLGLLATHRGIETRETGWPSVVLDLTPRLFAVGRPDRARAAVRFLRTMVTGTPAELRRAFKGSIREARAVLDGLVADGRAAVDDGVYRLVG